MAKLQVQNGQRIEEIGERGELFLQNWFNYKGYYHIYIDQRWETFADRFRTDAIKRPDWLLPITVLNKTQIIAVDGKSRKYNREFENYILDKHQDIDKLLRFQSVFGTTVWLALADPIVEYTRYWIKVDDVVERIEPICNNNSGDPFYPVEIKDCITIGWDDGLERLFRF